MQMGCLLRPLFLFSSEDVGREKRNGSALGSCWWGEIGEALRCLGCFSWVLLGPPSAELAAGCPARSWQHPERRSPALAGAQ